MKDSTKEHIKNAVVASVSAIPLVGGSLSVVLDKYLPNYIQNKRDEFLKSIAADIEEMKEKRNDINLESELFYTSLLKCTKLVIDEIEVDKIAAYRNIILNSSIPVEKYFDENTLFINWIQKYTVDQIRIIRAVMNGENNVITTDEKNIWKFISKKFPNLPSDYILIITQELVSNGILFSKTAGDYRKDEMKGKNNVLYFLTPLGKRFVTYITHP